jgi:hypothetical protein
MQLKVINIKCAAEGKFEKIARVRSCRFWLKFKKKKKKSFLEADSARWVRYSNKQGEYVLTLGVLNIFYWTGN